MADVEGEAAALYGAAGADMSNPPAIGRLCAAITGHAPMRVRMRQEGCLVRVGDSWRVYIRSGLADDRARFIVAHELAERWHAMIGYRRDDIEDRCDLLGAALLIPRPAAKIVMAEVGHSPKLIAEAFGSPQQLALLRIGEVSGRPVALVRRHPIVRGDEFGWPTGPSLARAVKRPPPEVHPVRVGDEWGLMAR